MAWRRLGRVFETLPAHGWMQSHASTPFPLPLENGHFRVFFSTRDALNQSSISWLELALLPEPRVVRVSDTPLLMPGEAGHFDDSGVTMSQVVRAGGVDYLYYVGWNLAVKMPFRNSIGLATAPAGSLAFTKRSAAPVLDRSAADPISLSYPWVMAEGGRWRMWYGSHVSVEQKGLDVEHVLKYAESPDGICWTATGRVCLGLQPGESGLVRPCVLRDGAGYHLWYSVRIGRKETYRLGYARSADGLHWQRLDAEAALAAGGGAGAWDGEMQCYPCVFTHQGRRYLLYNGNGFGRSGFGLAVWA